MTTIEPRAFLRALFDAAVSAADPLEVLAPHLPEKPKGRCIVVGAGKAAAKMAVAVERAWSDVDVQGTVVTSYGHALPTSRITVREASHPTPDAAGLKAAQEIFALAQSAGPDDLVLALISGGGSSLMPLPVSPLTLDEKIQINRLLLKSGLPITDMNKIRRRLSQIKGGGLARAAMPARLVTLAISDVPGDAPPAIASGPTVPDPDTGADLSPIVEKLGSGLPQAARELLLAPSPVQDQFDADYRLIATPRLSLVAAADLARAKGIEPVILGDAIEGEAREVGIVMSGIAKSVTAHGLPFSKPIVLLSGGETTVTVGTASPGRGGRNTEFLLSLAIALDGVQGVHALSADTDGIDGTEDAAGALLTPDTLARANQLRIDPVSHLTRHDSYSFFDTLDDLVTTGPTLTNVNDFRAILVL